MLEPKSSPFFSWRNYYAQKLMDLLYPSIIWVLFSNPYLPCKTRQVPC